MYALSSSAELNMMKRLKQCFTYCICVLHVCLRIPYDWNSISNQSIRVCNKILCKVTLIMKEAYNPLRETLKVNRVRKITDVILKLL